MMEDHRIELLLVAAELDLLHLGSASSSSSSSCSPCAWHMAHSLCEFIYIYILYIAIRIIVITRHVYLCTAPPSSSASSSPSSCTSPSDPSIPCDRSSLIWFYGLRILCKAKLCDHWLMMTLRLLLLPLMIKTTTVMANRNCTSLIK